jgi:hypothetical protein
MHCAMLPPLTAAASGLFMLALWATRLQPAPRVDGKFLAALMPVAFFHTVGHVSACVSFSQVCYGDWVLGVSASGRVRCHSLNRPPGTAVV